MNIDISQTLTDLHGWELSITIRGVSYATQPPTIGWAELVRGWERLTFAERIALIANLFHDPKPNVRDMNMAEIAAVIDAVARYQKIYYQHAVDAIAASSRRTPTTSSATPLPPAVTQLASSSAKLDMAAAGVNQGLLSSARRRRF